LISSFVEDISFEFTLSKFYLADDLIIKKFSDCFSSLLFKVVCRRPWDFKSLREFEYCKFLASDYVQRSDIIYSEDSFLS